MAEKKPSYSCFLETCDLKYLSAEERREHCIQNHAFPANFKFDSSKNQKKSKQQQNKKGAAKHSSNKDSSSCKRGGRRAAKESYSSKAAVKMSVDDDTLSEQQVLTTQVVEDATAPLLTSHKKDDPAMQQRATSPAVHLRKFSRKETVSVTNLWRRHVVHKPFVLFVFTDSCFRLLRCSWEPEEETTTERCRP